MDKEVLDKLTQLTEEEKKRPYAKYVYRDLISPSEEILEAIKEPMDPSKAVFSDNIDEMLKDGYMEVENGWCVLPDGGSYICINTKWPNCTPEMWNWFAFWRCEEDQNLRYKVWNPSCHYVSYCHNESGHEWMSEAFYPGGEVCLISGYGVPLKELGFSEEALANTTTITKGAVTHFMLFEGQSFADKPTKMTICHFVRPLEGGGAEIRSRFWVGYAIVPGKGIVKTEFDDFGEERTRALANHCASEFANLGTILPQLYAEECK